MWQVSGQHNVIHCSTHGKHTQFCKVMTNTVIIYYMSNKYTATIMKGEMWFMSVKNNRYSMNLMG